MNYDRPANLEELAGLIAALVERARGDATPSADAVLRLEDATKALPIRSADARRWIREHVPVLDLAGRHVVVWGDVLTALRKTGASTVQPGVTHGSSRRLAQRPRRIVAGVDLEAEEARWATKRSGRDRSR